MQLETNDKLYLYIQFICRIKYTKNKEIGREGKRHGIRYLLLWNKLKGYSFHKLFQNTWKIGNRCTEFNQKPDTRTNPECCSNLERKKRFSLE